MIIVKNELKHLITQAILKLKLPLGDWPILIDYSKEAAFGQYTTNVAMVMAKNEGKNPQEVAGIIADWLNQNKEALKILEKTEVKAPGFINFFINKDFLNHLAEEILKSKKEYGSLTIGQNKKIQVEFISANPTGPLTVGNGRGGFFGDALAAVLNKVGYQVTKEYLINDAGKQIEALGHSVLKDDQAVYKGEYIDELNLQLKNETDAYQVGIKAADIIIEKIIKKTVEEKMQIKFDVWFSERKQLRDSKKINEVIEWLKEKKHLYFNDNAWWFKSSDHNDTRDRVLVKSDGEFTYLAQDFAYLVDKLKNRKFDLVINIWGADHHGDVPGLLAAAKVLGFEKRQVVLLTQFVRLLKDGQEVRMSKRTGTYITMDELIDLVGHDVTRYFFLMRANNTHIDFDLDLAKEHSEKNPVYYVQYANARMHGILEQVKEEPKGNSINVNHESEFNLLSVLIKWPEILEEISHDYQVQKLTVMANDLADAFHKFYTDCRVIDNGEINWSRVKLVKLSKKVLMEVLDTIGVSSPDKM